MPRVRLEVQAKVFGVGLGKTGTTTLGVALMRLGYRHCGFDKQLVADYADGRSDRLMAVADRFDSFEDFPWPLMYRDLDQRYPGSRFVLTVRRSSRVWYDSLCRHAVRTGPSAEKEVAYGYPDPRGHEKHHVWLYEEHNRRLRQYFADRPGQLLVACWEAGDGWPELCSFLGRAIPDAPFPHANKRPGALGTMVRRMVGSL